MSTLTTLVATESKLFIRDPLTWIIALLLPAGILAILGVVFGNAPDPELGGRSFLELFAPSLIVVTLAMLGLTVFPVRLATYRQVGYLRRLSTVPLPAAQLIVAQLLISVVASIVAVALLVFVGHVGFGLSVPQDLPGFILAVGLGASSMFAIGLVIAAIAPTSGAGQAIGLPIFFLVMFLGGVYLPRVFLPDFIVRIGEYIPPGVQGIQDTWLGESPEFLPLAALAAITLVAGAAAVRLFRWQ